jgi:hypothetical protein
MGCLVTQEQVPFWKATGNNSGSNGATGSEDNGSKLIRDQVMVQAITLNERWVRYTG